MHLRVTLLELPARWGAPAAQLALVDEALTGGPATDLVVLPEAALGGYLPPHAGLEPTPLAEPLEGPTAAALAALARRHGCHLVGPLIEREGPRVFNAMVGFDPSGARFLHYRKRHPWYPEHWATPGDLPWPRAELGGHPVTAAICFDVHFLEEDPDAAEALGAAGLLIFPSAWVDAHDTLPAALARLARRFDLHVVNANWGPGAPHLQGQGGSMVIGRGGHLLARHAGGAGLRLDVSLPFP